MVAKSANTQLTNRTCKFTDTGDVCCQDLPQQNELAQGEEARIVSLCLINDTQHLDARHDDNETDDTVAGRVTDIRCLVCVKQLDQPEVGKTENKVKLHGRLQNYELDENFIQTSEDLNRCSCVVCLVTNFREILLDRCSCVVCLVANFREILLHRCSCVVCLVANFRGIFTFRFNYTRCDDQYMYNGSEAQRICEKFCDESKYDRYVKYCVNTTGCLRNNCTKIFIDVINCDVRLYEQTSVFPLIPTALRSKVEDGYFGIPLRQVGGTSGFVVLFCIYVTGLVLNCILIRIFIRHEEMRKDSKLIIINIAVADMLNLILHSPPIDTFLVHSVHSPLSVTYVFYMIVGLSIYSVMTFSCHIYLTVLPIKNRRNSGYNTLRRYSPHAHALTAAILACLVPVPLICVIEEYYTVSLYVLVAYCAVPLCCSTLFSVGTSLQLGSCVQSVHCGSSDHETLRGPRSNNANTLVALIVVSSVSYVPYFCLPFIPPYIGEDSDVHPFLIPWVFVWFSSFMNPIALYVANKNFRYYFNKYICFCCCGGRE